MKTFNKKVIAFLFVYSISLTSLPLGEIYANPETQKVKKDKTIEKATENALTPNKLDELNKPKASLATPSKPKDITNENIRETSREASDNLEEWTRDCFEWDSQDSSILTGLSSLGKEKGEKERDKKYKKMRIPEGTTVIKSKAFESKYFFNEVILPNSLKIIEDEAFAKNYLTKITIPDSVSVIGKMAFRDNDLNEITIPRGVTFIGMGAFSSNHIRKINMLSTNINIEKFAFYGQDVVYRPSTYPFEFKGIGISHSIDGSSTNMSEYKFYGVKTTSIDRGATQLYSNNKPDGTIKYSLSRNSSWDPGFKFDTADKYQYSGVIYIKTNNNPDEEDKPKGDIKISVVGEDNPLKQLEGAEFEIIETDEEENIEWWPFDIKVESVGKDRYLTASEISYIKRKFTSISAKYGHYGWSIESDFIIRNYKGFDGIFIKVAINSHTANIMYFLHLRTYDSIGDEE